MVAVRFALHDLVEAIRFGKAEAALMRHVAPRLNTFALANRKSGRIDLNSVYGETDVHGDVVSRLNRCLKLTWDRAKLDTVSRPGYQGESGDLLRLHGTIVGDGASLSESFFETLPEHLKSGFYRDGELQLHRAIIPDRRNDGNLLLSQFHFALARFHNRSVDYLDRKFGQQTDRRAIFARARNATCAAFHQALLDDVLPRLCEQGILDRAIRSKGARSVLDLPMEGVLLLEALVRYFPWPSIIPNAACRRLGPDELTNDGQDGLPLLLFNSEMLPTRLSQTYTVDWEFLIASGYSPDGDADQPHLVPSNLQELKLASGEDACRAVGFELGRGCTGQQTPLIPYILSEAIEFGQNGRLGPLGSFILARTIAGAMGVCGRSRPVSLLPGQGHALRALLAPKGATE